MSLPVLEDIDVGKSLLFDLSDVSNDSMSPSRPRMVLVLSVAVLEVGFSVVVMVSSGGGIQKVLQNPSSHGSLEQHPLKSPVLHA
jgi:hypothetical protein